jgi:hypothetical protein
VLHGSTYYSIPCVVQASSTSFGSISGDYSVSQIGSGVAVDFTTIGQGTIGQLDARIEDCNFGGTDVGDIPILIDVGGGTAGLPIMDGSNLTGVTASGGGAVVRDVACAVATHAGAAQVIGSSYGTLILDTATLENDVAVIDYNPATGQFTCADPGLYEISVTAQVNYVDATQVDLKILLDGTTTLATRSAKLKYTVAEDSDDVTALIIPAVLSAGSVITVQAQKSGGTTGTSLVSPIVIVKRLGAAGGTGSQSEQGSGAVRCSADVSPNGGTYAKITGFNVNEVENDTGVLDWDVANQRWSVVEGGLYLIGVQGHVTLGTSTTTNIKFYDETGTSDVWAQIPTLTEDGAFGFNKVISLAAGSTLCLHASQNISGGTIQKLSMQATRLAALDSGGIKDYDFAGTDTGMLVRTGVDTYAVVKTHEDTIDPVGATDDVTLGYSVGSRWFNTATPEEFVCLDATDGAAVWLSTTSGGGGDPDNYIAYGSVNSALPTDYATDIDSMSVVVGAGTYLVAFAMQYTVSTAQARTFTVFSSGGTGQVGLSTALIASTTSHTTDRRSCTMLGRITFSSGGTFSIKSGAGAGTGALTAFERALTLTKITGL